MSDQLEEARAFFRGDKYATEATGCVIDEVGEKYAQCSLTLAPKHRNAVGQVMGGVSFTLADFAFAVAANFHQQLTVSVSGSISHLGPVKGTRLIARTRLVKDGKRNCFYEVDVTDELDTPLALVTITGAHL